MRGGLDIALDRAAACALGQPELSSGLGPGATQGKGEDLACTLPLAFMRCQSLALPRPLQILAPAAPAAPEVGLSAGGPGQVRSGQVSSYYSAEV